MKHPLQLETERLIIRPYTEQDWDDFLSFMLCSQVIDYLNFSDAQKTPEGVRELLDMTLASYATSNPLFALVITQKTSDRFIGSCGFSPLTKDYSCECFYALLPEYWGRGLATEAMKILFDYGFNRLNINKIIAHINIVNSRSLKVAKKLGMRDCGTTEFRGVPEQGKLFSLTLDEFKK